jgi:multiple sugar transport system permease protein
VLWLVPIIGLLLIFSVFPIFGSFFLSLFDYEMLQPLKFIGINNFIYAFTQDSVFITTIRNTIYYAFVSVPVSMAISLVVAQFIFGRKYLQPLWRTIYFLPVVTPVIAVSLVWSYIFQPSRFGFLNAILGNLNVPAMAWLNSAPLVIPSLIGGDLGRLGSTWCSSSPG